MAVFPIHSRQNRRPISASQIHKRQAGGSGDRNSFSGSAVTIAIIATIIVAITACVVFYSFLRKWRNQGRTPKYIPTKFLKSKWQSWKPGGKYSQVHNRDLSSTNTAYNPAEPAGVDRNTSVRSTITLPPYSRAPKESEQVIGREGERGGMDTVVEYPETQDQTESRREEQMESLYQIRLARRRELEEREARRRERQAARDRGDTVRLEELRRESRQRAENTTALNGGISVSAATLIAEHQSRGRERRVSSVAYGSLGEVRHDGTRLRANSNDSERGGLLSGAAPMGEETTGRPRLTSDATSIPYLSRPHTRESSISALSVSSIGSDQEVVRQVTPGSELPDDQTRTRASNSSGTANSSPAANRYTPDESTGSEDIGESRIPESEPLDEANRPPQYENLEWGDAPSYEVAMARRAASNASRAAGLPSRAPTSATPRLPQLDLPSINISVASEPNTPVTGPQDGAPSTGAQPSGNGQT